MRNEILLKEIVKRSGLVPLNEGIDSAEFEKDMMELREFTQNLKALQMKGHKLIKKLEKHSITKKDSYGSHKSYPFAINSIKKVVYEIDNLYPTIKDIHKSRYE